MTAPPWSARCSADDRLGCLDDQVAELVADDLVDGETAVSLLRLNRRLCATPHGWDHAVAAFRLFRPGAGPDDVLVLAAYETFTPAQLRSLPLAVEAGAAPAELLSLGVCGLNCDGQDLPTLTEEELRRRMLETSSLSMDAPSRWLSTYAARLVAESRRRKGVGRPA